MVAKGFRNGEVLIEKRIETTGAPAKIVIEPYQETVKENGVAIFKISITDEEGSVVPTADNELHFEIEGAGIFLGAGNDNLGDHASDKIPVRRTFNSICTCIEHGIGKVTLVLLNLMGAFCSPVDVSNNNICNLRSLANDFKVE